MLWWCHHGSLVPLRLSCSVCCQCQRWHVYHNWGLFCLYRVKVPSQRSSGASACTTLPRSLTTTGIHPTAPTLPEEPSWTNPTELVYLTSRLIINMPSFVSFRTAVSPQQKADACSVTSLEHFYEATMFQTSFQCIAASCLMMSNKFKWALEVITLIFYPNNAHYQ